MLFLELIHLHAMFFVETFKVIEELLGFLNVVQGNIAPHSASSLAGISYRLVKSPSGRRQTSKTRQLRRFFFCHYSRLFSVILLHSQMLRLLGAVYFRSRKRRSFQSHHTFFSAPRNFQFQYGGAFATDNVQPYQFCRLNSFAYRLAFVNMTKEKRSRQNTLCANLILLAGHEYYYCLRVTRVMSYA